MKVTTTTKSDKSVWFRKNLKWYSYEEQYGSKKPKICMVGDPVVGPVTVLDYVITVTGCGARIRGQSSADQTTLNLYGLEHLCAKNSLKKGIACYLRSEI